MAIFEVTSASMISEVVSVSIDAIICGIIAAAQELEELDRRSLERSDRSTDGDNEMKFVISLALIKSQVRIILKMKSREFPRMHADEQQSIREESCGDCIQNIASTHCHFDRYRQYKYTRSIGGRILQFNSSGQRPQQAVMCKYLDIYVVDK